MSKIVLLFSSKYFWLFPGNAGISCQIIAADLVGLNRLSESLGLLLCLGGAMTFLGIPFAGK